MSKKVSITLDDEVLDFVDRLASDRSRFINNILLQEKEKAFTKELEAAYTNQANEPGFQQEISVWDIAVGDGLKA